MCESPAVRAAWGGPSTELSMAVGLLAHLQLPGADRDYSNGQFLSDADLGGVEWM